MHVNGYYAKVISSMELKSRLSQYSSLRLFLLRPTITDSYDEETGKIKYYAPMKILVQNFKLRDRFIRNIITMQKEVGVNLIAIPFIKLPLEQYKELVRDVYRSLNKSGHQPVFFFDMRYEENHFKEMIKLLTTEYQSNLIGLYHTKYRNANINYDYLSDEYARKDVAFISSMVDRSSLYDISTMHYLPFKGNDVYAIKKNRGFSSYEKDKFGKVKRDAFGKKIVVPRKFSVKKIGLFDKENLCIENINTNPNLVNSFLAEYKNDSFITALLKNYKNIEGIKRDVEALTAFSKVSELRSSQSEFIEFQDYIKQNSSSDYLDNKLILKRVLDNL